MKILVADDHPLTLQGTVSFVESYGYKVAHICSNGIAALNLIELNQPDVAILDINMPGMDGIDVAEKVYALKLQTRIILLTMHEENTLFNRAQEYGVFGYILKEHVITELEKCLAAVLNGTNYVSERILNEFGKKPREADELGKLTFLESKIVELISQQKTIQQMSEKLFLSEKEIEQHQSAIMEKLGLIDRGDLMKWIAKEN